MHTNLIVVGFHGKHRAVEVLSQLEQLAYDWSLDLQDAVAAYRTDDGRLRVDQSVKLTTKEGAGYGALIGGVLGAGPNAHTRRSRCPVRCTTPRA
jgi:uncharacterized membrane protein